MKGTWYYQWKVTFKIKALREFLHRTPWKPAYGPIKYNQLKFGKKVQYAENESSKPVNKKLKKKIQQVAGKFLYSGRAIDNTTMQALNELSIKASQANEETQESLEVFMDYLYTNPMQK